MGLALAPLCGVVVSCFSRIAPIIRPPICDLGTGANHQNGAANQCGEWGREHTL